MSALEVEVPSGHVRHGHVVEDQQPEGADAQGWIHHADGRYTLWLPRAEMGQHVGTALLQIASVLIAMSLQPWQATISAPFTI